MNDAATFLQIKDAGGKVIQAGNALPFTSNNQYFTLTEGDSPTDVTVPYTGTNAAIMEINLGNLGENGAVWVLPSDTPALTAPSGTVTPTTAQLVFNGMRRIVTPGQEIQLLYTSEGTGDEISIGISYYALSPESFLG